MAGHAMPRAMLLALAHNVGDERESWGAIDSGCDGG